MIHKIGAWDHQEHKTHYFDTNLCSWFIKFLEDKDGHLVDYGCGNGAYLEKIKEAYPEREMLGVDYGWEGHEDKLKYKNVLNIDLTTRLEKDNKYYDFINNAKKVNGICLEVGEHIPIKHYEEFLRNITLSISGHLILSWAIVGQPGRGHVNCKGNYDVIRDVIGRGFSFLYPETLAARQISTLSWFSNTLMIFKSEQ